MKKAYPLSVGISLIVLFLSHSVAFANQAPAGDPPPNPNVYVVPVVVASNYYNYNDNDNDNGRKTVKLCDTSIESSCPFLSDYQVKLDAKGFGLNLVRLQYNSMDIINYFPDSVAPPYMKPPGLTPLTLRLVDVFLDPNPNFANFTVEMYWNSVDNPIAMLPLLTVGDSNVFSALSWEAVTPQPLTVQLIDNFNLNSTNGAFNSTLNNGEILPLNVTTLDNAAHYLLLFNSTGDLSSTTQLPAAPFSYQESQNFIFPSELIAQVNGLHFVMTIDSVESLGDHNQGINITALCTNNADQAEAPCEGLLGIAMISVPQECIQSPDFREDCKLNQTFWFNASDYFDFNPTAVATLSTGTLAAAIAGSVAGVAGVAIAATVAVAMACGKHKHCRRTVAEMSIGIAVGGIEQSSDPESTAHDSEGVMGLISNYFYRAINSFNVR